MKYPKNESYSYIIELAPICRCNTPPSAGTDSARRGSSDSSGRRGVVAAIVAGSVGGGKKKSPIKNGAEIFTFNKDSNVSNIGAWLPDGYSRIFRSYVFGSSGFWTMAPLRYAAKFDPFLSLDCAPPPSTLAQSKERKG